MVSLRNVALFIAITCVVASPAAAQLEPPSTGGLVALAQELRMLGHNKRVLMIGAHPDDEDTELLTLLVRGMGAEAAYLSLNRGEGGQNLIGPELGEALGLIRTEELLAARRLDGARQFFTRAYDFGYSKSIEETWRFWPRDSVLKDVVRIVREFRPQIIVSIFSGTQRDGHGQHQAAGWAAHEAFRIAADSTRFHGLGTPWQPLKLYRSTRFDSVATTLTLDGGILDQAVGQSFRQIAMRGRSLHRSQDMGQLQRLGSSQVRLQLVEDRTTRRGPGLWDGIDTTLASMMLQFASEATKPVDSSAATWYSINTRIDSIRNAAGSNGNEGLFSPLSRLQADLSGLVPMLCGGDFCVGLSLSEGANQSRHIDAARAVASGLVVDAIADDERVVPGQTVSITASVWNTSSRGYWVQRALDTNPDHSVAKTRDRPVFIPPKTLDTLVFTVGVAEKALTAQPYYLHNPRRGGLYYWEPEPPLALPPMEMDSASPRVRWNGLPFEDPEFSLVLSAWDSAGQSPTDGLYLRREVSKRSNNQAYGEIRRPVIVVPRVDVKLDPSTEVWSTAPGSHDFTVTLTHGARDSTSGTLTLEVPAGWPAVSGQKFELIREDERETFRFSIRPPANLSPGKYEIRAVATDDKGGRYDQGVFTVDYPHIRPRSWTQASIATVNVASLEMPRLNRVGYIRGASDRVPEALASVGVPIELLDGATLERDDLSGFDAIVIGSRAYETDSSLGENNARVLAYARNGGLVIVQYQQHAFFSGHFAPYPMSVGGQPLVLSSEGSSRPAGPPVSHDRVTDETAPVRIIDPNSPVVTRPNRIGPEDWEGWVQERGLYFARSWDDEYQPVLEMADPGEQPLRGGLLVARYGKGTYVYTGISFFRELPAGVPGAFRLFANLLALGERSVP